MIFHSYGFSIPHSITGLPYYSGAFLFLLCRSQVELPCSVSHSGSVLGLINLFLISSSTSDSIRSHQFANRLNPSGIILFFLFSFLNSSLFVGCALLVGFLWLCVLIGCCVEPIRLALVLCLGWCILSFVPFYHFLALSLCRTFLLWFFPSCAYCIF